VGDLVGDTEGISALVLVPAAPETSSGVGDGCPPGRQAATILVTAPRRRLTKARRETLGSLVALLSASL